MMHLFFSGRASLEDPAGMPGLLRSLDFIQRRRHSPTKPRDLVRKYPGKP